SVVESTSAPTDGMPTSVETASPTTADREISSPSMAPTSVVETSAPTYGMPTTVETASPTTTDRELPSPSMAPTTSEILEPSVSPTPGSTGYETPSPTMSDGSRGGLDFETQSPTASNDLSRGGIGFETQSPTSASREIATASPTSSTSRGIPIMSASPTSGVTFTECTPGDSDTCYDQLEPSMQLLLVERSRGLTCEESCLVGGGLWCDALGLSGCRFCATSCDDFCTGQGLPDDCECIEC
ncbi:unnamed protein product, partial [Ectocarpus fasciculatus]